MQVCKEQRKKLEIKTNESAQEPGIKKTPQQQETQGKRVYMLKYKKTLLTNC